VSRLRLQGSAVAGAAVYLNGREAPAGARERVDAVVALSSGWGDVGEVRRQKSEVRSTRAAVGSRAALG
jgi:hypothetical protein